MTLDDDLLDLFNAPLPPPRPSTRAERAACRWRRIARGLWRRLQTERTSRRVNGVELRRAEERITGLRGDCATLEYERASLAAAVGAYARAMDYADAIQRTGFPADEVRAAWGAAQAAYDALCELAGVGDA